VSVAIGARASVSTAVVSVHSFAYMVRVLLVVG
jgi:hypothetical protein